MVCSNGLPLSPTLPLHVSFFFFIAKNKPCKRQKNWYRFSLANYGHSSMVRVRLATVYKIHQRNRNHQEIHQLDINLKTDLPLKSLRLLLRCCCCFVHCTKGVFFAPRRERRNSFLVEGYIYFLNQRCCCCVAA